MSKRNKQYAEYAEAFTIFANAKYKSEAYGYLCAEHDEIFAGPEPEDVSAEDRKRLEELGWTEQPNSGFHRFV